MQLFGYIVSRQVVGGRVRCYSGVADDDVVTFNAAAVILNVLLTCGALYSVSWQLVPSSINTCSICTLTYKIRLYTRI